jgi:hypothetical protein
MTTCVLKFWYVRVGGEGDFVLEANGFASSNMGDLAGFLVGIGGDGSAGTAIVKL